MADIFDLIDAEEPVAAQAKRQGGGDIFDVAAEPAEPSWWDKAAIAATDINAAESGVSGSDEVFHGQEGDANWLQATGGAAVSGLTGIVGGIASLAKGVREADREGAEDLQYRLGAPGRAWLDRRLSEGIITPEQHKEEMAKLGSTKYTRWLDKHIGDPSDKFGTMLLDDTSGYWNEVARDYAPKYGGTFLENPSVKRGVSALVQGGVSMAVAVPVSIVAGPEAGAVILSGAEAGGIYEAAIKMGKTPKEALNFAMKAGTATFLLEKYGLDTILKASGPAGRRLLIGMVGESGTESAQSVVQNAIAKHGYDEATGYFDGIIESAIGGLVGGPAAVLAGDSGTARKAETVSEPVAEPSADATGPQPITDESRLLPAPAVEVSPEGTAVTPEQKNAIISRGLIVPGMTDDQVAASRQRLFNTGMGPQKSAGALSKAVAKVVPMSTAGPGMAPGMPRLNAIPKGAYDGDLSEVQQEVGWPQAEVSAVRGAAVASEIDAQAHEAATSPANDRPEPTTAQIEAGNYKKGHISLHGLDISIENPRGSQRSGVDPGGKPWSVRLPAHYGYIRKSEGADGDHVDVYVGPDPESTKVFVVDQVDLRTGKFDEHKAIFGAADLYEASSLYRGGFSDLKGDQRRGAITEMAVDQFKAWLKNGDTSKPLAFRPEKPAKTVVELSPMDRQAAQADAEDIRANAGNAEKLVFDGVQRRATVSANSAAHGWYLDGDYKAGEAVAALRKAAKGAPLTEKQHELVAAWRENLERVKAETGWRDDGGTKISFPALVRDGKQIGVRLKAKDAEGKFTVLVDGRTVRRPTRLAEVRNELALRRFHPEFADLVAHEPLDDRSEELPLLAAELFAALEQGEWLMMSPEDAINTLLEEMTDERKTADHTGGAGDGAGPAANRHGEAAGAAPGGKPVAVPFQSEADIHESSLAARLKAGGIDEDNPLHSDLMAERRRLVRQPDPVTGLQKVDHHRPTLERAWEAHKESGRGFAYADIDLRNLGGFNKYVRGNAKANPHVRAIADIIRGAVEEEIPEVQTFRKGGDEFGTLAPDTTEEQLHDILARAQERVDTYVKENGFDAIPHPKGGRPGVGIYFGVTEFNGHDNIDRVVETADGRTALQKEDGNVDGGQIETSRAGQSAAGETKGRTGKDSEEGQTPAAHTGGSETALSGAEPPGAGTGAVPGAKRPGKAAGAEPGDGTVAEVPSLPSVQTLKDEQVSPGTTRRTLYLAGKGQALKAIGKGGTLYRALFTGDKDRHPERLEANPDHPHTAQNGAEVRALWFTTQLQDALDIARHRGEGVEIALLDVAALPESVYLQNVDDAGYLERLWVGVPGGIGKSKLAFQSLTEAEGADTVATQEGSNGRDDQTRESSAPDNVAGQADSGGAGVQSKGTAAVAGQRSVQGSSLGKPAGGPAEVQAEPGDASPSGLTAPQAGRSPSFGSTNQLVTTERAEQLRAKLRAKLSSELRSGIDPEILALGTELAVFYLEGGVRSFTKFSRRIVAEMGEAVKPYLKSWYMGARYFPGLNTEGMDTAATVEALDVDEVTEGAQAAKDSDTIQTEDTDVTDQRSGADLERNRADAEAADRVGEGDLSPEPGTDGGAGERGVPADEGEGHTPRGGVGVSGPEAVAAGERGDFSPYSEDEQSLAEDGPAGSDDGERGGDAGLDGLAPDHIPAETVGAAATGGVKLIPKRTAQKKAQSVKIIPTDKNNIDASLPFLHDGQRADVAFAEERFAKPQGYGVLFTNGTGTGKTYSGLGIAKRFERQGKENILIVVPDAKAVVDWRESGKNLELEIVELADTKDHGRGIVVATYANLGQNDALVRRDWDLVLADESHNLMQAKDGGETLALAALRAISNHPRGKADRHAMLYRPELDELKRLIEQRKANVKIMNLDDTMDQVHDSLRLENEKLDGKINALQRRIEETRKAVAAQVDAAQGEQRTRVAFLSATPFAYEKNVDYAEGYLFDYPEDGHIGNSRQGGFEKFMVEHFGHRIRYHKLTEPGPEVNRGLLQRQFNSWLKKEQVLAGRMLDVDQDYDRKFVLTENAIGAKIDEGLQVLWEDKRYRELWRLVQEKFDHLSRRYLLEAIKAREAVPLVKEHLALGRKVVVFHDYKKGGGFNPFDLSAYRNSGQEVATGDGEQATLGALVQGFEAERPDLAKLDLRGLASPIEVFGQHFPGVLIVNGDQSTKENLAAYKTFNDDGSGPQVLLVQSAKNAGWSGHDTTGKHQRVLFNLGMPTRPIMAIQQEGRIYRVGQRSNALFRYLNTGTNWERFAFATTIASRSSTAENLALGEEARALMDAFIQAFEESDAYPAGHEGEGIGGKERDRAANAALSEWDRATTLYFAQHKKTSRTKSLEGTDYFATPEPLGLKMVEWAGIRDGESALEPSAGHGAIARWFPEHIARTAIEPSSELASRLKMVTDAKLLQERFEDFHIVNKFDAIVMNPPFGTGGKTAIEHLDKATGHLREGGRVVALIPAGPAADKRFEKWFYEEDAKGRSVRPDLHLAAEVRLPQATFERAGTRVAARIVVIDKLSDPAEAPAQMSRDYSDAVTIKEFFERIEEAGIDRPKTKEREAAEAAAPVEEGGFRLTETTHAKKGIELFVATPTDFLEKDAFNELRQAVKRHGGYYSNYRAQGAVPGFQFESAEARAAFVAETEGGGDLVPKFSAQQESVGPVALADVEFNTVFNRITARMENTDGFVVVSTARALPARILAEVEKQGNQPEEIDGVFHRGKVYIVRQHITSVKMLEEILFHEWHGHAGLYAMFGNDGKRLQRAMLDLYASLPAGEMLRLAKKYRFNLTRYAKALREAGYDDTTRHAILMEELLTHLTREYSRGGIAAKVREIIGLVRDWLRKNGFATLAQMGETDIAFLLKRARAYAEAGAWAKDGPVVALNGQEILQRLREHGITEEMLTKLLSGMARFSAAWHGSPHDHDKFDMSKVGAGEGAPAYGHGLYFAGKREVAEHYRDVLSERKLNALKKLELIGLGGHGLSKDLAVELNNNGGDLIAAHATLLRFTKTFEQDGDTKRGAAVRLFADRVKSVIDMGRKTIKIDRGRLYHVELAPADDEYLDWDKPLSEQSEKVQSALRGQVERDTYLWDDYRTGAQERREMEGSGVYIDLAKKLGTYEDMNGNIQPDDKAASEFLHSLGIRGIRYLDGTSRGTGDGSSNYVIFDDADIEIMAKFSAGGVNPEIAAVVPLREAASFSEARQAAEAFRGRDLINAATGLVARVSRNSLDKMLNDKAVGKSETSRHHALAVANLDVLFQDAVSGWSKPDVRKDPNIRAIRRFFVPMDVEGKILLAKITVKETADVGTPNRVYSVESVEFNEKSPAATWVAAAAGADGIDLTSTRSARDIQNLAQLIEDFNVNSDDGIRYSIAQTARDKATAGRELVKNLTPNKAGLVFETLSDMLPERMKAAVGSVLSNPHYGSKKSKHRGAAYDLALERGANANEIKHEIMAQTKNYDGMEGLREHWRKASTAERAMVDKLLVEGDIAGVEYGVEDLNGANNPLGRQVPLRVQSAYFAFRQTISHATEVMFDRLGRLRLLPHEGTEYYQELVDLLDEGLSSDQVTRRFGINEKAVEAYQQIRAGRRKLDALTDPYRKLPWYSNLRDSLERGMTGVEMQSEFGKSPDLMQAFFEVKKQLAGVEIVTGEKFKRAQWYKTLLDLLRLGDEHPMLQKMELLNAYKGVQSYDSQLAKLKDEWRQVEGYLPRIRKDGEQHVKVWQVGEDGTFVEVWMQPAKTKFGAKQLRDKVEKNLAEYIPQSFDPNAHYEVVVEPNTATPEEIFLGIGSHRAIEALLSKVFDKAAAAGVLENQMAVQNQVLRILADEISARGFGRHKLARAQHLIEGYETQNTPAILAQFVGGMAGWLSKSEFAMRANKLMSEIPDSRPHDKSWVKEYVDDALKNSTYIDQWFGTARSFAALMYLGFKTSSAVLNATQNYIWGQAKLSSYTKGATRKLLKAQVDVLRDHLLTKAGKAGLLTEEERWALEQGLRRGRSQANFVRAMSGMDDTGGVMGNFQGGVRWLTEKAMKPFQAVETYWNREPALLAAFRVFRGQGLEKEAALKQAEKFVDDVHFVVGKENIPAVLRKLGPLGRTLYTFQSYTHNYLLGMLSSLGNGEFQVVARSLTALVLFGGLAALPFGDDLDKWYRRLFGERPLRMLDKWLRETAGEYTDFGDQIADFVLHGAPALAGVNFSRAIGVNIPWFSPEDESLAERVTGVWGGLAQKVVYAADAAGKADFWRAAEYLSPEALANILRAYRHYADGATTLSGRPVFGDDGKQVRYTAKEGVIRAFGFMPLEPSKQSQNRWDALRARDYWNERKADVLARFRIAKDRKQAGQMVREFNRELRGAPGGVLVPPITLQTLQQALRTRPDRRELMYRR
jgi:GGDEF domain-containing protein